MKVCFDLMILLFSCCVIHMTECISPQFAACHHPPLQWGLRLYGATVGGLGALLSLAWVAAHLSCLSPAPGGDPTVQR